MLSTIDCFDVVFRKLVEMMDQLTKTAVSQPKAISSFIRLQKVDNFFERVGLR